MAKIPPPSGKGTPPAPVSTVGNLDKPEPGGLKPLNFKVPDAFRREFKTYAAQQGKPMNRVLQEAFAALKHESTK
jgi:hypothetical protein